MFGILFTFDLMESLPMPYSPSFLLALSNIIVFLFFTFCHYYLIFNIFNSFLFAPPLTHDEDLPYLRALPAVRDRHRHYTKDMTYSMSNLTTLSNLRFSVSLSPTLKALKSK